MRATTFRAVPERMNLLTRLKTEGEQNAKEARQVNPIYSNLCEKVKERKQKENKLPPPGSPTSVADVGLLDMWKAYSMGDEEMITIGRALLA